MLTFLTLLLGIVWGPRTIELAVPANAASVQILLDGETVASRTGPPWSFAVDLGPAPAPHHLDAVARDAQGVEIARVRKLLNVARPEIDAVLALLPGQGGRGRVARLAWEGVVDETPRVSLSFDGKPLVAPNLDRIELPPYVPERLHFLRATLDFGLKGYAEAELTFGGRNKGQTSRELTAVPIRAPNRTVLGPDSMTGWLTSRGEALRVVAVEEGDASIVFVVDESARKAFGRLSQGDQSRSPTVSFKGTLFLVDESSRMAFNRLSKGDPSWAPAGSFKGTPEIRLVWAYPDFERGVSQVFDRYPTSWPKLTTRELAEIIASADVAPGVTSCPQLADALLAAGLRASAWSHPRAVVLLVSGERDASRISPTSAKAFLKELGVPLVVWTVGSAAPESAMAWDRGRWVKTRADVNAAIRDLEDQVAQQRIVWVEGQHLLRAIAVTDFAPVGVELVQ